MRKVSKFSEEEKEKSSNMIINIERHKNLPEDENKCWLSTEKIILKYGSAESLQK